MNIATEITQNLLDWSPPIELHYWEDIIINNIEPRSGNQTGGTLVGFYGSHFLNTTGLRCKFGDAWVPGM
jgi:hypothetical protein